MKSQAKSGLCRIALAALALVCSAVIAQANCRDVTFEDQGFTICEAHVGDDLRLFLRDDSDEIIGSFSRLRAGLEAAQSDLVFAMNAGMFHDDRRPVGLYVENGEQLARIVTREGPGNFGMLPNGVFCIADDHFAVIESRAYAQTAPDCRFATQSGPMLVIDGALHPRFLPDSTSHFIRNGVGVSGDGQTAYFAISNRPVIFHVFARLFRDQLGLDQALFLDGSVSRLYARDLNRADWGFPMGPMVGLVAPSAAEE